MVIVSTNTYLKGMLAVVWRWWVGLHMSSHQTLSFWWHQKTPSKTPSFWWTGFQFVASRWKWNVWCGFIPLCTPLLLTVKALYCIISELLAESVHCFNMDTTHGSELCKNILRLTIFQSLNIILSVVSGSIFYAIFRLLFWPKHSYCSLSLMPLSGAPWLMPAASPHSLIYRNGFLGQDTLSGLTPLEFQFQNESQVTS